MRKETDSGAIARRAVMPITAQKPGLAKAS
jgi:hypothetical protein